MKDNKKHKKAEYGILITGLIILLAATCVIALCAGQYSVSVPEVIKILASRFVNVTKTWSNTAEGVVFTLRLPRMIGAVLVGSALSLSGAAYQGVFKNPLVAPDLLGVSSGACVGASVAILLHLNYIFSFNFSIGDNINFFSYNLTFLCTFIPFSLLVNIQL